MLQDKFNLIFLILLILISVIRKIYLRKLGCKKIDLKKTSLAEIIMFTIIGLAMLSPLIFIFSSLLNIADYYIPDSIRWVGVILFISASGLLLRSHADLGKNWTFSLDIKNKHTLITKGVYKHIRHPMYAAHLLWALAQLLIIPNWIAGPSFLLFSIPFYMYRVPKEENLLIKEFGKEYKDYMKKTGRIFPKFQ
jgi:protein-S-isoprenylcysteine O-methyltransferase Ste14